RHQHHPRAALRARGDDPGRSRRTYRRHPADWHRHRAGPVLTVPGDGLPHRPGPGAPARRGLPVPRPLKPHPAGATAPAPAQEAAMHTTRPATLSAVVLERYRPPEVLQQAQVPRPSPGPKDVLIRVAGVAVSA